jgi:hypothetical protein
VAIEVVHHTKKAGAKSDSETHAGDVESGRGASSLKDACRIAITLARMSPKTATALGINYEDEGRFLVRLDAGKGNFSGPPDGATWFKQVSVLLSNGDTVGVHEVFDMQPIASEAEQLKVESDRAQVLQYRLDICETLPEGVTELPVLLSNLVVVWGVMSQACRNRTNSALVLDEAVRVTGSDNVEYDITLTSRSLGNDKHKITKEAV